MLGVYCVEGWLILAFDEMSSPAFKVYCKQSADKMVATLDEAINGDDRSLFPAADM